MVILLNVTVWHHCTLKGSQSKCTVPSNDVQTTHSVDWNTNYLLPSRTSVEQVSSWQWNRESPLQTLYRTGSSECPRYTGQSRGLQEALIYCNHKKYSNSSCQSGINYCKSINICVLLSAKILQMVKKQQRTVRLQRFSGNN